MLNPVGPPCTTTLPCRNNSNSKKRTQPDKLSLVSRSQPDLFSSVDEDDDNAEVAAATAATAAAAAAAGAVAADAGARYAAEKLAANQIKVRCQCCHLLFGFPNAIFYLRYKVNRTFYKRSKKNQSIS